MKDETRNLNPIPEAIIARVVWGYKYAFEQKGGSMDFWDSLSPGDKKICKDVLKHIIQACKQHGYKGFTELKRK